MSIGCFVVVGPNGYAFVESEQPLIELEDYCRAMRRNYACNNCGWQVHFKDNDSHAGDRCKKCDQGTYQIVSDIDIDANMARIKKLVAANPERYTKIVDGQVTTKKSQDARTP